jgi:hypothetical protein
MSQTTVTLFAEKLAASLGLVRDHVVCIPDDSTGSEDWVLWGKEFLRRKVRR